MNQFAKWSAAGVLLFAAMAVGSSEDADVALETIRDAKGKYGLAEKNRDPRKAGRVLVTPKYDWIGEFEDDKSAPAQVALRFGRIDRTGREIVPLKYDYAGPCKNGAVFVYVDGKVGALDCQGGALLPIEYDWIDEFSGDYTAAVKGSFYGVVDRANRVIVPFDKAYASASASGYSQVWEYGTPVHEANRAYYGPNGQSVEAPPRKVTAGVVTVREGSKYGLALPSGESLLPSEYDSIACHEGDVCLVKKDKLYGAYNTATRNMVITPAWHRMSRNGDALIAQREPDSAYTMFTRKGEQMFGAPFADYRRWGWLPPNVYVLKKGEYWGVLDHNGKAIIPFEVEEYRGDPLLDWNESTIMAMKSSGAGVTDHAGKIILPFKFQEWHGEGLPFEDMADHRLSVVRERGSKRVGVLNSDFTWALPLGKYDNTRLIDASPTGLFIGVASGDLWGVYDLSAGRELIKPQFKDVRVIGNFVAVEDVRGADGVYVIKTRQAFFASDFSYRWYDGDLDLLLIDNGKCEGLIKGPDCREGAVRRDGSVVVPLEYKEVTIQYDETPDGVYGARYLRVTRADGRTGFLDRAGEVVIPVKYDTPGIPGSPWQNCGSLFRGHADLPRGGELELLNVEENDVVAESDDFDLTGAHHIWFGDVGAVQTAIANKDITEKLSDRRAVLRGKLYTQLGNSEQWQETPAEFFSEGLMTAQRKGKWGFLDQSGREVTPFEFDVVGHFQQGRALVKRNGRWERINRKGDVAGDYDLAIEFRRKRDAKKGAN